MSIQFWETVMGRRFFEGTMPKIAEHLERLTKLLEKQAAAKPQYYAILTYGLVEPEIAGPFETHEERDTVAKEFRRGDHQNISFWLDVAADGKIAVGSFTDEQMGES